MTTDATTGSMAKIEAAAREAGLGELQVHRSDGAAGCSPVVFGGLAAVAGAVLIGLGAAGLADEVMPVVGVIGMLLALLVIAMARGSGSMKQFMVACGIAVLLGGPSFFLMSLDDDSSAHVAYALGLGALLIVAAILIIRGAKTKTATKQVESLSLFDRGAVYVGPNVDDWRPIAFPWNDTALEEVVASTGTFLHHTVTLRRGDGYWVSPTLNPTQRVDRKVLRQVHEVMAARLAGPLVEQMRAGQTVVLGGALRGNAEGLSVPSTDGSPSEASLSWHDIKDFGVNGQSFVITGKKFQSLEVPVQDVRDLGVLKGVVAIMQAG